MSKIIFEIPASVSQPRVLRSPKAACQAEPQGRTLRFNTLTETWLPLGIVLWRSDALYRVKTETTAYHLTIRMSLSNNSPKAATKSGELIDCAMRKSPFVKL